MTPFTSRAALAVTAGALVLTLSACSGGEEGGNGTGGDGAAAEERELGPLDEYFEQIYGGEGGEELASAQQMLVEEITAECMRAEGFAYTRVYY